METIKQVWKNLKDGWSRCQAKLNKLALKSGSKATGKRPTCKFYDQLVFLGDSYNSIDNNQSSSSQLTSAPTSSSSDLNQTTPKLPYRESFKRQKHNNKCDSVERELLRSIKDVNAQINQQQHQPEQTDEGANMHFCKSLAPLLDNLSPEKNILARIKLQQVLYDIQFNKSI